jgi:hypothetical protein
MEVRWFSASGKLTGLVGWCYSIGIATMAYIVVEGDIF